VRLRSGSNSQYDFGLSLADSADSKEITANQGSSSVSRLSIQIKMKKSL